MNPFRCMVTGGHNTSVFVRNRRPTEREEKVKQRSEHDMESDAWYSHRVQSTLQPRCLWQLWWSACTMTQPFRPDGDDFCWCGNWIDTIRNVNAINSRYKCIYTIIARNLRLVARQLYRIAVIQLQVICCHYNYLQHYYHHYQHSAATATILAKSACPKLWVQPEIIVELKVPSKCNNPITEYLLCNVSFGCTGK